MYILKNTSLYLQVQMAIVSMKFYKVIQLQSNFDHLDLTLTEIITEMCIALLYLSIPDFRLA